MYNKKKLQNRIIKFADNRAVTTIDDICIEFNISKAKYYRIKGKRLVSSINENGRYITTSARVKRYRGQDGIYRHGNLIFHTKSDIYEIIIEQIGKSKSGCTERELYEKLGIHCHKQLTHLVENNRIKTIQMGKRKIYFTKRKWKTRFRNRLEEDLSKSEDNGYDEVCMDVTELTKILDEMKPLPDTKNAKHEYTPLDKFKAICTLFALDLNSYKDMQFTLQTDDRIRESCFKGESRVIDYSTLCYFMGQLKEEDLTRIFVQLVMKCNDLEIIDNKYLAVDATHVVAWANTRKDTNEHPVEGATWSRKTKSIRTAWFGYKLHIIVDCKAELPIAFVISTGKDHDSQHFIPLLKFTKENYGDLVDSDIFSDSAYWQPKLVEEARVILKAELYSAINPRRSKIWKNIKTAIKLFFINFDRAPITFEELMAVIGQETLDKYGLGINEEIQAENSMLMRAVKERMNRNYRAAVERVFSRLKGFFGLNSIRTKSFSAVKKHIIMSMIVMLLMSIAMNNVGIPPDKRKFVKVF